MTITKFFDHATSGQKLIEVGPGAKRKIVLYGLFFSNGAVANQVTVRSNNANKFAIYLPINGWISVGFAGHPIFELPVGGSFELHLLQSQPTDGFVQYKIEHV